MANILPGEFDFPLDEQAVFVGADRKRRLADALRQQTTTPQGQMVGGIYVAPSITQYLATGLKGYQANKLEREGTQEVQDAYRKRFQIQKDAAQRYADALRPKQVQVGEQKLPFEASQMDRFGSPMQGQVQATQPVMGNQNPTPNDMFNAQLEYAQALGDPRAMQQAVQGRMQYDIQQQTRQDERQFRSQENQLQREQRMQEIMLRLQDNQLSREQNAALRREMAQLAAGNRAPRAPVAILDPNTNKPVYVDPSQAVGRQPYYAGMVTPPAQPAAGGAPTQPPLTKEQVQKLPALDSMNYVIDQFRPQLGALPTGGVMGIKGRVSSMTNYQDAARFNNLREQLSTELRTIFRIPGEGALSDKEQAQYGIQLPDVKYDEGTNQKILDDVRARASIRLGQQPANQAPASGKPRKKFNPATGRIE